MNERASERQSLEGQHSSPYSRMIFPSQRLSQDISLFLHEKIFCLLKFLLDKMFMKVLVSSVV